MRVFIYILLFIPFIAAGQARLEWLINEVPLAFEDQKSQTFHSSIRPFLLPMAMGPDTVRSPHTSITGKRIFYALPEKRFQFLPLADLGFRQEKTTQYRTMLGLGILGNFGKKWYARLSYLHGVEKATDFFQLKNNITLPLDSLHKQKIDLRGRVSFTPNRFFNFQAGWDNQFIGEGNRSLFLSDYGVPHGFAQARLNFWHLEYLMLYQFMNEQNEQNQRVSKFASSHYLSYNATKWLRFGFFETVVFQPKDTLLNRGFEPEYLNPMILFRPQEYALGSTDNVLIGLDVAVKIKRLTFYGQVLLDEFNLPDIKARTRWWANKYAIQMGVKTTFRHNQHQFFVRGEMNIIRPYTYSHLSINQSYTNQGSPLAHPNGANLSEILAEVRWQQKRWKGSVFASYSLKGYDIDSVNWGGNIAIPYINRPVELNDFGHKIGQGKGNNAFLVLLRAAYTLQPAWRLDAFVEGHFRYNTYLNAPKAQLLLGIRSQLWNDYRNY